MRTEILTTVGQIQKIEDAWLRLLESYPLGFFNGPVYYNLAHYRRGFVYKVKYPLYFIVVLDEKDGVCGILPTCRRRFSSKLLFLNGEASEIIAEPERREEVLSELENCINARRLWIHSDFIHEGSLLQELYRRFGWEMEAWNTSYYADLSEATRPMSERTMAGPPRNWLPKRRRWMGSGDASSSCASGRTFSRKRSMIF